MIRDGVIRRAHAQTEDRSQHETREREDVHRRHGRVLKQIHADADEQEQRGAQEVRVDVDGFIVQIEQTLEAGGVAVTGGAVVGQDEVVILLPRRQVGEFEEARHSAPRRVAGGGGEDLLVGEQCVECHDGCGHRAGLGRASAIHGRTEGGHGP